MIVPFSILTLLSILGLSAILATLSSISTSHAEHLVAEWMGDIQMATALVQRHVDKVPPLSVWPSPNQRRSPRIHEDVLAEVLRGQAEMDEGGTKDQGLDQLQEEKVVVVLISAETAVKVQSLNWDELYPITWETKDYNTFNVTGLLF